MTPITAAAGRPGPPRWLMIATAVLTFASLFMAVAETTLWTHFLVDRGEYLSLIGLAFILAAGLYLHGRRRLLVSLPLIVPWLLYPVVTQADQLIDHLTINQMRAICHAILAVLFATPVAVVVLAAVYGLSAAPSSGPHRRRWMTAVWPGLRLIESGRAREGAAVLALASILVEILVAQQFLGTLMVATLIAMGLLVLWLGFASTPVASLRSVRSDHAWHRMALWALVLGVLGSALLFTGFRNRPGAYQGSPHYYHDPSRRDAAYAVGRLAVPEGAAVTPPPDVAADARGVLAEYAALLEELSASYYVLDRNYNYAFHNALFLRHTPILSDFRALALARIARVRTAAAAIDARQAQLTRRLSPDDPLRALLDEMASFVSFNLRRAAVLERMSGEFERTQAGLQHATHLYEGEGKVLGVVLGELLEKHRGARDAPALRGVVSPFVDSSRRIQEAYANRIVGF